MQSLRFHAPLLSALAALACAACPGLLLASDDPGSRAASSAPTAAAASGKPGPVVRAVGKANGSGVVLSYAVPEKIALGETVTVRLSFAGVTAADGAAVEVREVATRRQLLTLRLQPGDPRTVEFSYTARADGLQYLDVTTQQAQAISVQSVPLRVGSGKLNLKEEGRRVLTPSGENLVSLPSAR